MSILASRRWLSRVIHRTQQRALPSSPPRPRPLLEVLEDRLAPAVQLGYGGPGSILELTETLSGATPTVAISEPTLNLLTIDLGTGNHFDPSSTGTATGLTYSSGTPAASQSATVSLDRAGNVSTLQAALTGDTLVLGPILDALGGLGNVAASAGTIRVAELDTSHASVGNGNVDLKAAGDLTVGIPVLPHGVVLDTGTGALALAADVNADGTGNNGAGTLMVQPGSVVVSANATSGAITLRGSAAHLGTSAGPALVGARSVLDSNHTHTATPFVTTGLNSPRGFAFDASGNLYAANFGNSKVSQVAAGTNVANPFITSGLSFPQLDTFDASGNLYVANAGGTNTVSQVAAGTSTANPFITSGLSAPTGLAFDASGNLYVANAGSNTVSRVAAGTRIATPFVTSGLSHPVGLAFDASGNLYIANFNNNTVSQVAAGTSTATPFITSGLSEPDGLAFDASGNLYVANAGSNTVSKVTSAVSPPVAGGVVIRSSLPGRPMLLGDTSNPVDGINLSSAELARIQNTGPLTFDGGGNGALELNDQDKAPALVFTVTASTVAWDGPTLSYTGLSGLTLDGGFGGNTFNVLSTSATTGVTLVGGGSGDTLAGSDAGNLFALVGNNAGTLSGSAYGSSVTFSGVGNLTAGAGGDTFQFADAASLTGTIAGAGSATLDYSAYTTSVMVDLQTGFATGVSGSVSGILSVLGGSATPAGAGVYNLLIGNGGNTLTGGTGRRNLLVAGGSASTLVGGDNEDLLIGGSTTYDTETGLVNWLAIANYWAGSDGFTTRAANLRSGTGVPLLDATVVTGNGGGNVMNGNGALALIFTDGMDTISGFDPNSQQVTITP